MKCPKCNGRYLEVHGNFTGFQKIEFKDDGELDVIDSEPHDFEWEDDDAVRCNECGHEATVAEFKEEQDQ